MERFIVRYHVYMCSPFPSFAAAAAAADAMAAVALNSLGSNSNPFQFLIIGIIDHFTVWYPIANNRKSGTRIAMGDSINNHQSFPSFTGGMQALKINAQLIVCSEYIDIERERERDLWAEVNMRQSLRLFLGCVWS